ncbi:MAG: hypothetical protein ACLGIT_12980 [Gammaproteobacteria bacterium]
MACVVTAQGAAAVAGVVAGRVDDFEDGTTRGGSINLAGQGWSTFAPVNVASGGPSGVDDNHLLLTSIGADGPGGRLIAFAVGDAWQGDDSALGIGSVRLHAIKLGSTDLALRLRVANPGSGPPTDLAFSSTALALPAGVDWTLLGFSLALDDLTAALGSVTGATAQPPWVAFRGGRGPGRTRTRRFDPAGLDAPVRRAVGGDQASQRRSCA